MHNCTGYSASGGPWITPEKSTQKVVWTSQKVAGNAAFDGILSQPETKLNYYKDITVLAVPEGAITQNDIVDISEKMDSNGRLIWKIPAETLQFIVLAVLPPLNQLTRYQVI